MAETAVSSGKLAERLGCLSGAAMQAVHAYLHTYSIYKVQRCKNGKPRARQV